MALFLDEDDYERTREKSILTCIGSVSAVAKQHKSYAPINNL